MTIGLLKFAAPLGLLRQDQPGLHRPRDYLTRLLLDANEGYIGQGGCFVVEARRQVVITLLLGDLRIGQFLAEVNPGGFADETLTNRILGGGGWRWRLRKCAEVDGDGKETAQGI